MSKRGIGILLDGALLGFMVIVVGTVVFLAANPSEFLVNLIYLMITFILVIITYFTSIIAGLIFNIIFIFGQVFYMAYGFFDKGSVNLWDAVWLFLPGFYCLTIYFVTDRLREIQDENVYLKKEMVRLSTLDTDTQLRTLNMFDADFTSLEKLPADYQVPLSLLVVRIRYWDTVKGLMNNLQIQKILQEVTKVLNNSFPDENFKYIIDRSNPTWGVMAFLPEAQMRLLEINLKEQFNQNVALVSELANLNIDLVVATSKYDAAETPNATDFLADGIRELQYDV